MVTIIRAGSNAGNNGYRLVGELPEYIAPTELKFDFGDGLAPDIPYIYGTPAARVLGRNVVTFSAATIIYFPNPL